MSGSSGSETRGGGGERDERKKTGAAVENGKKTRSSPKRNDADEAKIHPLSSICALLRSRERTHPL